MKTTTRATIIALVLAFLFALAPVRAAANADPQEQGKAYRYGHIEIEGSVPEMLPPIYLLEPDINTMYSLSRRLEQAAEDDSLRGLIIDLRPFDAGWSKIQELREQIFSCRRAGKEVICYLEGGGNKSYYLASAASRVVLVPSGSLMLVGLRGEVLFFKNLLDMIGLQADYVQIGKYKGAAEPATRNSASEAFREAMETLIDDMYRQLVEGIARGRNLDADEVRDIIDNGPYTAREAQDAGLVDDVKYYDQLLTDIREGADRKVVVAEEYAEAGPRKIFFGGPEEIFRTIMGISKEAEKPKEPKEKALALVYAVGPIIREDPGDLSLYEYVTSAERMKENLRELVKMEHVKAIVVRIDSPGGSAVASDIIWRELRRANRKKPVICSMSDTAASGGYYIAAGGRTIFAEPGTITGSIGVVGGKMVFTGLFGKLGLNVEVFQRGQNAGLYSSMEKMSERERERLQKLLSSTYETFMKRVAESRDMPMQQVREGAKGRPWTGSQAREQNLVDRIGGLRDALGAAKKAAGISPGEDVRIIRRPRPESLLQKILGGTASEDSSARVSWADQLPIQGMERLESLRTYLTALRCLQHEPAAALMPAIISIK